MPRQKQKSKFTHSNRCIQFAKNSGFTENELATISQKFEIVSRIMSDEEVDLWKKKTTTNPSLFTSMEQDLAKLITLNDYNVRKEIVITDKKVISEALRIENIILKNRIEEKIAAYKAESFLNNPCPPQHQSQSSISNAQLNASHPPHCLSACNESAPVLILESSIL